MSGDDPLLDQLDNLAHQLVVALLELDLHAPTDTAVEDQADRLLDQLRDIADHFARDEVLLDVSGPRLSAEGQDLPGASLQAGRLLRLCHERGIDALHLNPELRRDQLLRFLALLGDPSEVAAFAPGNLPAALARRGVDGIGVLLRAETRSEGACDDEGETADGDLGDALRRYQSIADFLHDNHVHAARGDEIELDLASGVVERTIAHMSREPTGLLALAMQDDVDSFTVGHSIRVTLLALHVAQAAGVSRQQLLQVGTAALLHDIGKARIPESILFKTGVLSVDERRVMEQHARLGGELLIEQDGVDPIAVGAAFCHHMGADGSGYPAAVLPFEPSGVSKLVRVCDVFEALTSARPYKPAMAPLQAYVIMERMRGGFDPRWLRFFIRSVGLFPIGTRVELEHGHEALVVDEGPTLHQPVVRLVADTEGRSLPAAGRIRCTAGEQVEGHGTGIRAILGAGEPFALLADQHEHEHAGHCACTITELIAPAHDQA